MHFCLKENRILDELVEARITEQLPEDPKVKVEISWVFFVGNSCITATWPNINKIEDKLLSSSRSLTFVFIT